MQYHRTIQFVGAVVALLLVVELGLHAVGDRLPAAMDWYHVEPQSLIDEMDRLDELGLRSDVVFVGSSMVGEGIDIPVIERDLPSIGRAHNAALAGAQTTVVGPWLVDEVVPRLQPQRVVWGVSSWEFNPNTEHATVENYRRSRALSTGFFGATDRLLAGVSMASRHRYVLRLDHGIRRLIDGPGSWEDPVSEIPAEDLLSREHVDRSNRTPEELAVLSNELLVDWEFGDSERDAFLDTVAELQGSGIETVVVLMPVPSENVEAHPGGRAEFESFRAEVLALGSEHGFIVLDYSRDFSDTSFMDYTHLRPDSAATFSATLANDLAELGW